ncbi:hypothetical protein ACWT_2385 [Actinoplanes sp. SE50]|uniref:hypothetical protein n=1 Tax=unclassified Actinoplanes TaxID=2626549 RepID=UPI00023EBB47|nr:MULTISPECIES: hypothetical protein [unclassified Actinoplanes]AEV83407.1 hypothetical protein ACPL_2512 [Actinoplanes sp. SE50/110]ATO81800.1 hypothetical protein ACWT_2385 [Actinoplanes sp. SE50]SLL99208.1 hypothetical protein ACSP50_2439 [Actinoplanes sp. SE50/110]
MTKKTVAALLLTGLAISLLGAVLTLLLHAPILGYQRAHQPHADPAALSRTLWTRPLTVFVVAILYARFVRQLLRGDPRALRRVRIVSAAGLAGVCWLLVSAAYPAWLRAIQIGQLVVLAALVITVNLRTVRSAFDAPVPPDPRPRNGRAAWTLILLTPVVAELTMGNVALRDLIYFPIFIPIYGAGALLIRETTRRLGGGTAGLLLLGLAYGILEEGLALQGLTSPHLYHAADWAPRLLGLNTAYAELNLIYHPVFSVLIPITLTEHLFRTHGDRPYLRRGGLISTAVVAALGAGLLRIAVPPTMDPGYQVPLLPAVLFLTVAALLAAAAYGVRRKPARRGPAPAAAAAPAPVPAAAAAPAPAVIAGWTGAAALGFLALIFPFAGARQPFFTHGTWVLLPMAGAAVIVLLIARALRRWRAAPTWTAAHRLAACFGALTGHTVFGLIANADTLQDRLFLGALAALTVTLGARAIRPAPGIPAGAAG